MIMLAFDTAIRVGSAVASSFTNAAPRKMDRASAAPCRASRLYADPLGAMTMIALAHNHQGGLQITTLSVYSVGVSAAFFVLLAHDRPFGGYHAVEPIPIEQAIERIERSIWTAR
jgi:hypothetical protein